MKQKEVTINGAQYPVVFTLDTLFGVEDIIGGSFFEANFGTLKNRMALVLAAIYSADDKADITVDQLKAMEPMQMITDITAAFVAVSELMNEFFRIPEAEKQNEPEEPQPSFEESQGEEKAKN